MKASPALPQRGLDGLEDYTWFKDPSSLESLSSLDKAMPPPQLTCEDPFMKNAQRGPVYSNANNYQIGLQAQLEHPSMDPHPTQDVMVAAQEIRGRRQRNKASHVLIVPDKQRQQPFDGHIRRILEDLRSKDQETRHKAAIDYITTHLTHYDSCVIRSLESFLEHVNHQYNNVGTEIIPFCWLLVKDSSNPRPGGLEYRRLQQFIMTYGRKSARSVDSRAVANKRLEWKAIVSITLQTARKRLEMMEIRQEVADFFDDSKSFYVHGIKWIRHVKASTVIVLYQIELLYRLSKPLQTQIAPADKEAVSFAWKNLKEFWKTFLNYPSHLGEQSPNFYMFEGFFKRMDLEKRKSGRFPRERRVARLLLSHWLKYTDPEMFFDLELNSLYSAYFYLFLEDCGIADFLEMIQHQNSSLASSSSQVKPICLKADGPQVSLQDASAHFSVSPKSSSELICAAQKVQEQDHRSEFKPVLPAKRKQQAISGEMDRILQDLVSKDPGTRASAAIEYIKMHLSHYDSIGLGSLQRFLDYVDSRYQPFKKKVFPFSRSKMRDMRNPMPEDSVDTNLHSPIKHLILTYGRQNPRSLDVWAIENKVDESKAIVSIVLQVALKRSESLGINQQVLSFFGNSGLKQRNGSIWLSHLKDATIIALYQIELIDRLSKPLQAEVDPEDKKEILQAWEFLEEFWKIYLHHQIRLEAPPLANFYLSQSFFEEMHSKKHKKGGFPRVRDVAKLLLSHWISNKDPEVFSEFKMNSRLFAYLYSFLEDCAVADFLEMVNNEHLFAIESPESISKIRNNSVVQG